MLTLSVLKGSRTGEPDRVKRRLSARLSVCWKEELTVGVMIDSLWLANLGRAKAMRKLEALSMGCRARAGRIEARIAGTLDRGMRVKPVVPEIPLLCLPPTHGEVVQLAADRLRRLSYYYEQYARLAQAMDDPSSLGLLEQNGLEAQQSVSQLDSLTLV